MVFPFDISSLFSPRVFSRARLLPRLANDPLDSQGPTVVPEDGVTGYVARRRPTAVYDGEFGRSVCESGSMRVLRGSRECTYGECSGEPYCRPVDERQLGTLEIVPESVT